MLGSGDLQLNGIALRSSLNAWGAARSLIPKRGANAPPVKSRSHALRAPFWGVQKASPPIRRPEPTFQPMVQESICRLALGFHSAKKFTEPLSASRLWCSNFPNCHTCDADCDRRRITEAPVATSVATPIAEGRGGGLHTRPGFEDMTRPRKHGGLKTMGKLGSSK